ncbi:MAG: hypothetical protein SAK29_42710, partial [Scytonema sp. PMC 1069.18]|nr:hypothetical protein [Scytonema sp. PMC 1069.18]
MEEINSTPLSEGNFVEILSRLEAETIAMRQSAIDQAVDYMMEADLIDERRDILSEAKKLLLDENPRELYLFFLKKAVQDLKTADTRQQYRIAQQINDVALAGLGVWQEDLKLSSVGKNQFRISGTPDWDRIEQHINETVLGEYFLQNWTIPIDTEIWGADFPLRLSACDASQHRLKLKVPTNKIWASPAIVNNAGGVIKEATQPKPTWKNIAVPKGIREYEDWVILGPSDYAMMDEGDYEWSAKSAMDVGQFFVEETFVFRHGGT